MVRDLHVLGLSGDGCHLLLGSEPESARASHRIEIDDRLRAALRGDLGPPGTGEVRSALSPREIQARLRAGETPDELARAAGVPVVRVLRYAGPVLSEQAQVVQRAQAATMRRTRRGDSAVALGDAVRLHLSGLDGGKEDSAEWSASRRPDGRWVVAVTYQSRGKRRRAEWLWDTGGRSVTPLDATASVLGHLDADEVVNDPVQGLRRVEAKPARRKGAARRAKPGSGTGRGAPGAGTDPRETAAPGNGTGPARQAAAEAAGQAAPGEPATAGGGAGPGWGEPATAGGGAGPRWREPAASGNGTGPAGTPHDAERAAEEHRQPGEAGERPERREGAPVPAAARAPRHGKRASIASWSDVLLGGAPPQQRSS